MNPRPNGSVDPAFWRGRRIFVTGHTGFKGSWLVAWLHRLGAVTRGYALPPATEPSMFAALDLAEFCDHREGDVRDAARLREALVEFAPEVVMHLAAQPLVRASYEDPAGTWATNVMGTAHLLEAVRACPTVRVVVVVTSDKCYENLEVARGYRETDRLGGRDPYSASKAAVEQLCDSWRRSFFAPEARNGHAGVLATVRAGNVLGGGDWAADRLIPDAVRAFADGREVRLRFPDATRPWQHVVEPLRGYLVLAQAAWHGGAAFGRAYNFGPRDADIHAVRRVMDEFVQRWGPPARWTVEGAQNGQPHEARLLHLDCARAEAELGWTPRTDLAAALDLTVEWYRAFYDRASRSDMRGLTVTNIEQVGGAA